MTKKEFIFHVVITVAFMLIALLDLPIWVSIAALVVGTAYVAYLIIRIVRLRRSRKEKQ